MVCLLFIIGHSFVFSETTKSQGKTIYYIALYLYNLDKINLILR